MDLTRLLADDDARRARFPNVVDTINLAHCASAPLSGPAAQALRDYADSCSRRDQNQPEVFRHCLGTRAVAARLLGCAAEEVALLGPTSLGLSQIAGGLDWRSGDEVICYADDYPANVYPWLALAGRGITVKRLRTAHLGVVAWSDLEPLLSARTRLVSLSSCHYLSGHRPDLTTIGRELHRRGVLLCVDAIQTLGAFPLPLEHIDFAAADSHKWLLGPSGAGVLYVKREHIDHLRPLAYGVGSVLSPDLLPQDSIAFAEGARRFEAGTPDVVELLAMRASLELLLDCDPSQITARILDLRTRLRAAATDCGWQPMHADAVCGEHEWRSGILTLRHPTIAAPDAVAGLRAAGVICTSRVDATGTAWLRLAPHAYLADAEIDRAIAALTGLGRDQD